MRCDGETGVLRMMTQIEDGFPIVLDVPGEKRRESAARPTPLAAEIARQLGLCSIDAHHHARGAIVQRQQCVAGSVEQRAIRHVARQLRQPAKRARRVVQSSRAQMIRTEQLTMPLHLSGRRSNALEPFIRTRPDQPRDFQKLLLRRGRHRVGCQRRDTTQRLPRKIAARGQRVGRKDLPDEKLKGIGRRLREQPVELPQRWNESRRTTNGGLQSPCRDTPTR
jgi:hypothetical protein